MSRNPLCRLCERYKTANNVCMWGRSVSGQRDIMIVIDNPNKQTDITGLYSQGQGGAFLVKLLTEMGWTNTCYITSAVKCYSPTPKPKAVEMKACRKYLLQEIADVQPKLIICLGSSAINTIFGKAMTIKKVRQRFFDFDYEINNEEDIKNGVFNPRKIKCKTKVACTFSFNVVFVDPSKYQTLLKDLEWIKSNNNAEEEKFDYVIAIEQDLPESSVYGLDIETTGLQGIHKEKILTLALADPISKIAVGYNVNHGKI